MRFIAEMRVVALNPGLRFKFNLEDCRKQSVRKMKKMRFENVPHWQLVEHRDVPHVSAALPVHDVHISQGLYVFCDKLRSLLTVATSLKA